MNQNQYKQLIQNMKNQHVQYANKIKVLENELSSYETKEKDFRLKISNMTQHLNTVTENFNIELNKMSGELEHANQKISEMSAQLNATSGELGKKNDAFYHIDKIIFRNNEYFDEVKKELDHKIAYGNEMNELYKCAMHELHTAQIQLESVYKELGATKSELQMYKNDFILKSASF